MAAAVEAVGANTSAASSLYNDDAGHMGMGLSTVSLLVTAASGMTAWSWFFALLGTLVVLDQIRYFYQKGSISGPRFKIPIIGPFFESTNPAFEGYLAKWRMGDITCISIFHNSRDLARKAFNSPQYCKPCVVPIAHKLLGSDNFVFLDGQAHQIYRKGLNSLFTRQALDIYLPLQEQVYDQYFDEFLRMTRDNGGKPLPYMPIFRELMCAVSCRTFVGEYISQAMIKKIADEYYKVTAALELVNFPIILPFTRPWYGKYAADMVIAEFAKCAAKAKVRMRAGGEIGCILDAWVKSMLDSERYLERQKQGLTGDEEKPGIIIKLFTDREIALTLFAFLFASQDATSSACTWMFQIMADNPEMLDKVRQEVVDVRGKDLAATLSVGLTEQMPWTRAIVKETLRYRPPVLMVPYLAKKPFPITDTYTAPKNAVIVPSTYPALHDPEVYPDPDSFVPERWISGNADAQLKNWLVFGTGPHYCIGQQYATMNLMALISRASARLDWKHEVTKDSEKIKVFATIFPKDDCRLAFTARPQAA